MEKYNPGLYIHIPFCIKRCKYCSFTSYEYTSDLQDKYIDALQKEIMSKKNILKNISFYSVYIGGGTPTVLSEKSLSKLFTIISNNFILQKNAEITIEANPGTLNINKLKILKNFGINRLSIGAQSFEPRLLKILGRIHSDSDICKSFNLARDTGFDNINLDLLFAIPSQTKHDWENTLQKTVNLKPEHISMYNLTYEKGTAFYNEIKKNKLTPLSSDIEFEMYRYGINFLQNHKYKQYEISNFSLKVCEKINWINYHAGFLSEFKAQPQVHSGIKLCSKDATRKSGKKTSENSQVISSQTLYNKQCKHNLLYWQNKDYFGFGVGSVSCINNIRYSNTNNLIQYINKISQNENIVIKKEIITQKKQIQEAVMLGLRLTKGLSKKRFKMCFGKTPEELFKDIINNLQSKKLLKNTQNYLKLTRRGVYLNNDVLTEFM